MTFIILAHLSSGHFGERYVCSARRAANRDIYRLAVHHEKNGRVYARARQQACVFIVTAGRRLYSVSARHASSRRHQQP